MVSLDPEAAVPADRRLLPLAKRRGHGPEPEVLDLAAWAAWRWAGRRASFLTHASADHAVPGLPRPARQRPAAPPTRPPLWPAPAGPGVHLRGLGPAADPTPIVAAAAQLGPTLVVVPSLQRAGVLAGRLRRAGAGVALLPQDWPQARAGAAVVVGARAAAWAPCPDLAAVVVLDGHDEGHVQEGAPTWSAVEVAAERARRAGVPCLITSPCPTPELLARAELHTGDPVAERGGWATIEVIDRREDDPRLGLYSERLVNLVRSAGRVACILNRTGRIRLLACAACGELARCEHCHAAMTSPSQGLLDCPRCGRDRPSVCARCGSIRMKNLRVGASRAREDLERLSGRPVGEVSGPDRGAGLPGEEILVGTEALLHRLTPASGVEAVAFVDFDQELLAPRVRAPDEALALLALASRVVRGRAGRVLVQTRTPEHPVVLAARAGDPSIATDAEMDLRRALRFPPFAAVAVVHGDAAGDFVEALREAAGDAVHVYGPEDGRWLLKADTVSVLCDALAAVPRPAGPVRIGVDPARL